MRDYKEYTVIDEAEDNTVGNSIHCEDFKYIVFEISTASSAEGEINFAGSLQGSNDEPDFSSAAEVGNAWDYIGGVDMEDSSPIDGDGGITYSGSDEVRLIQLNVDGLKRVTAILSSHVAGSFTVKAVLFN